MIAAVQLKRRVAGARIFCIVIHKLSHWQEPGPIILLEIDEGSKVGLHGTVLPLRLTVSLRIESGGKPMFDPKKITKR